MVREREMYKYGFFELGERSLPFRTVFLVGPCRSGKSTMGRLLGSLEHCYHIEENWTLLMTPIMCEKGLIDRDVFVNMYRTCLSELVYDAILMRSSSFRPSDHSYIGRMKSPEEIDRCISGMMSRGDVDSYMRENNVTVVFNLAEINPYIDLLQEVHPHARIVHMDRDPFIVAEDVDSKGWLNDANLSAPGNKQVFLRVETESGLKYIPFWVRDDDVQRFINMTPGERAFYYVLRQYELTAEAISRSGHVNIIFVGYAELLDDPEGCLGRVLPEAAPGPMTPGLLKEIKGRSESGDRKRTLSGEEIRIVKFIEEAIPGFNERYLKREKEV